jgi:hypothetical protein
MMNHRFFGVRASDSAWKDFWQAGSQNSENRLGSTLDRNKSGHGFYIFDE